MEPRGAALQSHADERRGRSANREIERFPFPERRRPLYNVDNRNRAANRE
jgi:hypothetical protein